MRSTRVPSGTVRASASRCRYDVEDVRLDTSRWADPAGDADLPLRPPTDDQDVVGLRVDVLPAVSAGCRGGKAHNSPFAVRCAAGLQCSETLRPSDSCILRVCTSTLIDLYQH